MLFGYTPGPLQIYWLLPCNPDATAVEASIHNYTQPSRSPFHGVAKPLYDFRSNATALLPVKIHSNHLYRLLSAGAPRRYNRRNHTKSWNGFISPALSGTQIHVR